MSNEPKVRTRVLGEAGAWVEADDPIERIPKTRRFVLIEGSTSVLAEGVCWADGTVAVRLRGEQRSTAVYDAVEDVIAANTATLTWVD